MKKGMLTLAALLLGSNVVHAEVVRYPIPNSTFPIAVRWFVRNDRQAGRDGGELYAANTTGAALGALLAGFILIPAILSVIAISVAPHYWPLFTMLYFCTYLVVCVIVYWRLSRE